jgi:iron complex outermembrane receptor protein
VTLVGERAGDLDNSFGVDRYTVYDATIRYAVPGTGLELSLTARNLTDADYIESTVTRLENYPGAPRSILGAVRARF